MICDVIVTPQLTGACAGSYDNVRASKIGSSLSNSRRTSSFLSDIDETRLPWLPEDDLPPFPVQDSASRSDVPVQPIKL